MRVPSASMGAGPGVRSTDKELLAVVSAFKQWRVYVEGAVLPVSVYTNTESRL